MNTLSITITLSEEEALSVRLALNLTACEWADKAMEHEARGERDDYDTCQRLRAKYHALWERVHDAQRAAELARREARADAMFASEARDPFANTAQWEASIERGRPRLDFVNNRGE